MSFDFSTLVTDRTQADVEARNDKGTYQAADLNRVTAAMKDLAERFSVLGYVTDYQDVQTGGGSLPEGYKELEYIESSGTQYIDTGVKPNQDTRVVFDYFPVATKNTTMFGSRTSTSSNDRFLVLHANNNDKLRSDYGGTNVDTGTKPTSRTVIDKNKAITTIGDRSWTNSAASFSGTYPMTLCALNNGGSITLKSSIRLYSCQIYDNGTLIRDYIPCTSAEGTVGLYDLVKKQFYGNAGTGSFQAGPEIPTKPQEEQAAWSQEDAPTAAQMKQYLANVEALRRAIAVLPTTPATPESMELLDYIRANEIEQILADVDDLLKNMAAAWYYSGEVYCGEV